MPYLYIWITLAILTTLIAFTVDEDAFDPETAGGVIFVCVTLWPIVWIYAAWCGLTYLYEKRVEPEKYQNSKYWVDCDKQLLKDGNGKYYFQFKVSPNKWKPVTFLDNSNVNPSRFELKSVKGGVQKFRTQFDAEKGLELFLSFHQQIVNESQSEIIEYWAGSISTKEAQDILDNFESKKL